MTQVPVAADSGADRLLKLGVVPQAVIGDMDSISDQARAEIPLDRQHLVGEQLTTDFDKALRLIEAPLVLALGFAGARLDHGLAAMATLVARAERRCILIGPQDLAFAAPARLELALAAVSCDREVLLLRRDPSALDDPRDLLVEVVLGEARPIAELVVPRGLASQAGQEAPPSGVRCNESAMPWA